MLGGSQVGFEKPSVSTRQELSEIVRHNKQAGLTKKHNQSIFGDDQGRAERNIFGNREQNTRARNDACGCKHAANRAEASELPGIRSAIEKYSTSSQ